MAKKDVIRWFVAFLIASVTFSLVYWIGLAKYYPYPAPYSLLGVDLPSTTRNVLHAPYPGPIVGTTGLSVQRLTKYSTFVEVEGVSRFVDCTIY